MRELFLQSIVLVDDARWRRHRQTHAGVRQRSARDRGDVARSTRSASRSVAGVAVPAGILVRRLHLRLRFLARHLQPHDARRSGQHSPNAPPPRQRQATVRHELHPRSTRRSTDSILEDGSIKINLRHQALSPPSFVEGDVIQAALRDEPEERLGRVPVQRRNHRSPRRRRRHFRSFSVAMDLTYHATILDLRDPQRRADTHVFADGTKTKDFSSSGSASGVGDLIIRSKYHLLTTLNGGVGGRHRDQAADRRRREHARRRNARRRACSSSAPRARARAWPTSTSATRPRAAAASDQINYVGGVEYAASPKVTVVGDILDGTWARYSRSAEEF